MLQNLQRLQTFALVFELGSLRAAALRMHVTQSALSQQLAKLEAELGAQLFVRTHKRLVPTPDAERLAKTVRSFLRELDEDIEAINESKQVPSGWLRVGAPRQFGAERLPPLVAAFRRLHAGVRFEVTLGHPAELLPMVESGQLDVAFADVFDCPEPSSPSPALFLRPVLDEELLVVASGRYHRATLGGDHSFSRVSRASFVCYTTRGQALHHWFRHHFRKGCPSLDVVLSVHSVPGVVAAVKADLGLGLVPAGHVAAELLRGRLVEVGSATRRISNRISLVQLQDKRPSAAERAFAKFVVR